RRQAAIRRRRDREDADLHLVRRIALGHVLPQLAFRGWVIADDKSDTNLAHSFLVGSMPINDCPSASKFSRCAWLCCVTVCRSRKRCSNGFLSRIALAPAA